MLRFRHFDIIQQILSTSSHIKPEGGVHMVDVSAKVPTRRMAIAAGRVELGQEAFDALSRNAIGKGDVLTTAQVAGIQAAKDTSRIIPLCHLLSLEAVDVTFELIADAKAVDIRANVTSLGRTGVEMEALTAVSVAALVIYDMCKSVSKKIRITGIRLIAKEGGKSGSYLNPDPA